MKLLLQLAVGWHQELINISYEHHNRLSIKHGYEFRIATKHTTKRHIFWQKPTEILQAIEDGYTDIAYLDADALWVHSDLYHSQTPLSGVMHFEPMPHFNAGVLYINGLTAKPVIEEWLAEDDDEHPCHDQHGLYKMLLKHPEYITQIGNEWNSLQWTPSLTHPDPIVAAWHGGQGSALPAMKHYLNEYLSRTS